MGSRPDSLGKPLRLSHLIAIIIVSFYSSPHLVHVTERIRLNGVPISKEKFAQNFWHIHDCLSKNKESGTDLPPYFTFLTVMAYYTFLMEKVGRHF